MGKKKISEFANKAVPVGADLFLIEDGSTGVYYKVTETQLAAIMGGSQTLAETLTNGNIMEEGQSIQSSGFPPEKIIVNIGVVSLEEANGNGVRVSESVPIGWYGFNYATTQSAMTHPVLNYFGSALNSFDAVNNEFPNETASQIAYLDASKNLKTLPVASYPSLAELAYVKGATSNLQTQINALSGGGDALTSNPLSQFAATTSAQLAGVISDETGSGLLVFNDTPTLITPVLGVATATSINKVILTAPATTATLTLANNTTTSITGGGTIALGGFTATVPQTTTLVGKTGTAAAAQIPFYSDANQLTTTTTFTYTSASGLVGTTTTGNVAVGFSSTASGTGTAARAELTASNGTYVSVFRTFGTNYTASGLVVANIAQLVTTSNVGILYSSLATSTFHKWTVGGSAAANEVMNVQTAGLAINGNASTTKLTVATAYLHIAAGLAAAGGAPLKLTSGVNNTVAEPGALEFNGNLFFTRAGTTRESVFVGNDAATAPATTAVGVITDYYGTSATRVLTTPNSWASVVIAGTTYKIPLYA